MGVRAFIAPFNNMRNLKFISPRTVAFSLPSINVAEVFEVFRCDWWISIHFESFCFSRSVDTGLKGHVLHCDWWVSIHFVAFAVGFRFLPSVDCRHTNI